ncbi:MAG: hypothetical protein CM1200mP2_11620 [Planctomycetaceae bacterium]|nr:MAG: hypothetical protein CM1200mP2_11620 [Planctomycetaceae bacterium]
MLPIPVPRVSPPLFDSTIGQLPLESLKAFRRDLCPLDLQFPEFLEADNYRNAGVTDRQTASQVQNFQLNQPLQFDIPSSLIRVSSRQSDSRLESLPRCTSPLSVTSVP